MSSQNEALWAQNLEQLRLSLVAQADRIRAGSKHSTIKGTSLEVVLRRTLIDYLPNYFRVGSGQIVNARQEVSPQLDGMVYDHSVFPHLTVNEDSSVLICCESLFAAIESKAEWNRAEIHSHYLRFKKVETGRHEYFSGPPNAAGYFVVVFGDVRMDSDAQAILGDASRSIGVYSVRANKAWSSPFEDSHFIEQEGGVLSCFLRDVLSDCMRKGQKELGTFEIAYKVVESYFGTLKPGPIDKAPAILQQP